MKAVLLIPLALLGVGLAGSGGGGAVVVPPAANAGEMQVWIREMAATLGLDNSWVAFLEAAALGESGFNPYAYRGVALGAPTWGDKHASNAEASGAKRAFERHPGRFAACGWPVHNYTFGSGGLWAILPANGLAAFVGTDRLCMSPWAIFDGRAAIVMILEYCRRLMGWDGFQKEPTWANLRVGMRAATYMGRPDEIERQRTKKNKLGDRLEQLGYDRAFADGLVTPLPPRNPVQWLTALGYPA